MRPDESLLATISSWPWYLSIIALLLAIVLVLVVSFIILRLGFGLWGHLRKQREVKGLHRDLMLWSRLSSLVRGGHYSEQAKHDLSNKLLLIEQTFRLGLQHVKQHHYLQNQQSWWLLVGEPQAGKSTLLQNSALDWRYARQDDSTATGAEQPLQMVVGPHAVMVEVKGRLFFDAWAHGSGAEFAHIVKLLRRYKRGRDLPLEGIMLCIPADALLADHTELTQRKAALIADELLRLTRQLNLYLPVVVMVTKLDEVLGFREYAAAMGEKMAQQALGFAVAADATYSSATLHDFFAQTCARLQDGALSLMVSPEVLELNSQGRSRLDKSALLYLFAQNFATLEEQLQLYLNTIFRPDAPNTPHYVMLRGVYFCSACDTGVCFNADFAALSHHSIDEALYFDRTVAATTAATSSAAGNTVGTAAAPDSAAASSGESAASAEAATGSAAASAATPVTSANRSSDASKAHSNSYFIKEALLRALSPTVTAQAHFNRVGRYHQQLPWVLASSVCTAMSIVAIYGAIWQAPRLQHALQDDVLYYQSLAQLFAQKVIDQAGLFYLDPNGQPQTNFERTMPHLNTWTRLNFFSQAQLRLNMDEKLPWQFYPWALLLFHGTTTTLDERYFIYNQIQTKMAYLPLVQTLESYLSHHQSEPYTLLKRNTLFAFMEIASFHELNAAARNNQAYNADIMGSFLAYLYPQLGANLERELRFFLPEYDYYAQATNDALVLNVFYQQLCESSSNDFIAQWQQLRNYPESDYQQLKAQVLSFERLEQLRQELTRLPQQLRALHELPTAQQATALFTFNRHVRALQQQWQEGALHLNRLLPQLVQTTTLQLQTEADAATKQGATAAIASKLTGKSQAAAGAAKVAASAAAGGADNKAQSNGSADKAAAASAADNAAVIAAITANFQHAYDQQQQQLQQDLEQLKYLQASLRNTRLRSDLLTATTLDANRSSAVTNQSPDAAAENAYWQELQHDLKQRLQQDYEQTNARLQHVLQGPLLQSVNPAPRTTAPAPANDQALSQDAIAATTVSAADAASAAETQSAAGTPSAALPSEGAAAFDYEVLTALWQRITLPPVAPDFTTVQEAMQALLSLDRTYHQQQQSLKQLLSAYAQTPVIKANPHLWEQLLTLQYQEAQIDLYQQILAFYPDANQAQTQLADLSLAIGRYPLEELLQAQRLNPEMLLLLGQVRLREEFNPQGFTELAQPVLFLQQQAQHGDSHDPTSAPAAPATATATTASAAAAPAGTSAAEAATSDAEPLVFNCSQDFLRQNGQLQSLWQALQLYARSYLSYWAHLSDSVEFSAHSYYEFHLASQQFKAYELNAQLQKLYELSLHSLEQLPQPLLSSTEQKQREQAVSALRQRLQSFSLDFNEVCASVLNAWSQLPYSALQATRQVNAMVASGQSERLFALTHSQAETYVPWWDRFSRLGRSLLQQNVHEESALTVNALLEQLDAFPLAADADSREGLSRSELTSLYQQFKLLGLEQLVQSSTQNAALAQAENAAATAAAQAMAALGGNSTQPELEQRIDPMAFSASKLQALEQIGSILHTLVSEPQMKMQILLVDAAAQQVLKQRLGYDLPLALLRYRYVSLEQEQSLNANARLPSDAATGSSSSSGGSDQLKESAQRWEMPLDSSDFALHFYRYSGQETPTVSLKFTEVYPLLDLYTRGDGFYDEAQNCYYVPLYIVDPQLGTSIYFVGLHSVAGDKDSQQSLPAPDKWPQQESFRLFL